MYRIRKFKCRICGKTAYKYDAKNGIFRRNNNNHLVVLRPNSVTCSKACSRKNVYRSQSKIEAGIW